MSWVDKQLRKHKLHKEIENAMRSPEFQNARKQEREEDVTKAFVNFLLITCDFLEKQHNYKKKWSTQIYQIC